MIRKPEDIVGQPAKRYSANIGVDAIYQAVGGRHYYDADHANVVTNGRFIKP